VRIPRQQGLRSIRASLTLLAALVGCAPERDPVSANQVLAPNDTEASVEWTDKERHEAIAAMRDALAGTPAEPPTPAPYGVRWSDVWISVYWGVADYEMAILRFTEETEGRMVFELESALDEPATLVIEKVAPPECIRSHATVGSFGQREEIARGLEVSFRRYLEAFGKKPGFEKPGFRWELPPSLPTGAPANSPAN
jgi:hypothetical protein